MSSRKLSVEVELETDKAKRQAADLAHVESAAESASERQRRDAVKGPVATGDKVSEATERLTRNLNAAADSASKAARNAKLPDVEEPGNEIPEYAKKLSGTFGDLSKDLDKASDSAKRMDGSTKQLVRGFTGLAVGLAGSYAASHMKQGAARDAVEYGTSAISGASAGAMMGSVIPGVGTAVGAVVGGAVGVGKTWLDKSGEKSKYTEEWNRSEHDYANNKAFAEFFRNLTDTGDKAKGFAERMEEARAELQRYKEVEAKQVEAIEGMIKQGRYDDATLQRGYLSQNRSRQEQLENVIRNFEDQLDKGGVRASLGAVDALSRLGGDFTDGGGLGMDIQKEQLDVLRSIERKTGGTARWR